MLLLLQQHTTDGPVLVLVETVVCQDKIFESSGGRAAAGSELRRKRARTRSWQLSDSPFRRAAPIASTLAITLTLAKEPMQPMMLTHGVAPAGRMVQAQQAGPYLPLTPYAAATVALSAAPSSLQ